MSDCLYDSKGRRLVERADEKAEEKLPFGRKDYQVEVPH